MKDIDLSKIRKVYFIGIGGIGISALAKLAYSRGMEVSGVNDDDSPATLDPLKEMGINVILKKDYKELFNDIKDNFTKKYILIKYHFFNYI